MSCAGRNLRRIDLPDHDAPRLFVGGQVDAQRLRARLHRRDALVESVDERLFRRARRRPMPTAWPAPICPFPADRAAARWSRDRGRRPASHPARASRSMRRRARNRACARRRPGGKDHDAATLDDEVVIAAAEVDAAQLGDAQAPALRAIKGDQLVERQHAVRQALQMAVRRRAGQVVEQQHGATAAGEVLLERQHLAAIAQRTLGQQADLRQRIEHQPFRLDAGARGRPPPWSSPPAPPPTDGTACSGHRRATHRRASARTARSPRGTSRATPPPSRALPSVSDSVT